MRKEEHPDYQKVRERQMEGILGRPFYKIEQKSRDADGDTEDDIYRHELELTVVTLEAEISDLLSYAGHQRGCTSYSKGPCSCGWGKLIKSIADRRQG